MNARKSRAYRFGFAGTAAERRAADQFLADLRGYGPSPPGVPSVNGYREPDLSLSQVEALDSESFVENEAEAFIEARDPESFAEADEGERSVHLPQLLAHASAGTRYDLTRENCILRWSHLRQGYTGDVDVVVHFHGFTGHNGMRLQQKADVSGVDLDVAGLSRPTVGIVPHGHAFPARHRCDGRTRLPCPRDTWRVQCPGASHAVTCQDGFDFPALEGRTELLGFVQAALAEVARERGSSGLSRGRLIVTGHSGGGAHLSKLFRAFRAADEITAFQFFDATYGGEEPIIERDGWLVRSLRRDAAAIAGASEADWPRYMLRTGRHLRLAFIEGTGTAEAATAVDRFIQQKLRELVSNESQRTFLRRYYRAQSTIGLTHNAIPRALGGRLLVEPGDDFRGVSRDLPAVAPAPRPPRRSRPRPTVQPAHEAFLPEAAFELGEEQAAFVEGGETALTEEEEVLAEEGAGALIEDEEAVLGEDEGEVVALNQRFVAENTGGLVEVLDTSGGVTTEDTPASALNTAPLAQADVNRLATVSIASARDINAFFARSGRAHFAAWYNAELAGKGPFTRRGHAIRIPTSAEARRRFDRFWDQIQSAYGRSQITLLDFAAVMCIVVNETGGQFEGFPERCGQGRSDARGRHPGLAYAFDRIIDVKRSYNTAESNRTAGALFNDREFIRAHGSLPGGSQLAGRGDDLDRVWHGEIFPQQAFSTEEDPARNGFIMQADFYKFRGRGVIQTTGRESYLKVIRFILRYQGTSALVAEYRDRWQGLTEDVAATVSTTQDWDRLFDDPEILASGPALHGRQGSVDYRIMDLRAEVLNHVPPSSGNPRGTSGSIYALGRRVSGRHRYGAGVYRDRVLGLLNAALPLV